MSFINHKKEVFNVGDLVEVKSKFLITTAEYGLVGLIVKIKSLESIRQIYKNGDNLDCWNSLRWILEAPQPKKTSEYFALVLFNKKLEVFSLDVLTNVEKN